MIIALGIELAIRQLYFLNVLYIQNYIDKGRVFGFTKAKTDVVYSRTNIVD